MQRPRSALQPASEPAAQQIQGLKSQLPPEISRISVELRKSGYRQDRVGKLRGKKGSNFEGGHRVPGIFHWPEGITPGHVEHEPAGMVDLLPTLAGLLGIDPPADVHLDGTDLTPLLTGRKEAFSRSQPLFWFSPDAGAAIRDGKYSLVAYPGYQLPKDREGMQALFEQVRAVLEETNDPALTHGDLWTQMFNGFDNKEAERIRIQFIRLNEFRESWIPTLKAGGFRQFQLFDLEQDITQRTDVSAEHPEVFERLKQALLKIHASIMADGPDWSS